MAKCEVCYETIGVSQSYGAITCPSCRVFFRRLSIGKRGLGICFTHGNCEITKSTRNNCQFCRYQKCLKMGMDPQRVHRTKNKGECLKEQSKEVIDLAVKALELPLMCRPNFQVTSLRNVESSMPFTREEMGFCWDLKKKRIGNAQLFLRLILILYTMWRFEIVSLFSSVSLIALFHKS